MEKLTKDLFKDKAVEANDNRVAGALARPCLSQIGGNSYCYTSGVLDLVDIGGG
jgi:hypothetical protein